MKNNLFFRLVQKRMHENSFIKYSGIELMEAGENEGKLSLEVEAKHLNPNNRIHGGVLMTMADSAMGLALAYLNERISTVDLNYHFLRPAFEGDIVVCEAETVKAGRTMAFTEAKIWVEDKLIGIASASFIRMGKKIIEDDDE